MRQDMRPGSAHPEDDRGDLIAALGIEDCASVVLNDLTVVELNPEPGPGYVDRVRHWVFALLRRVRIKARDGAGTPTRAVYNRVHLSDRVDG
ncbi:hypothetical protein GCM10009539_85160 [Cryptosporangium japonicum]|uniref:Uncharacterized protein n=1 Tax=Cryptosporangium japonicum TaxID=80872 RepID=A0ABP3F1G4_9ACTN